MKMLFMMPRWEDVSSGWMMQMMSNIYPDLSALAVNDSKGSTSWNALPVFSLKTPAREIRYLSRLFNLCKLSLTHAASDPQKILQAVLRKSESLSVFCQYGTYAVGFMEVWRKLDIPLFIHFHGYDATFDLRLENDPGKRRHPTDYLDNIKELSRKAMFIVNSRFTQKLLLDAGIATDRIFIKYFGIPVSEKGHKRGTTSDIQILHLGRLVDFKSPDRTIQAFEIAKSKGLNGRLILAGDGALRTTCEILRLRSPYRSSIHIIGNVNLDKVKQLFAESDIFTQHNIQGEITRQSECFGVSILEAMATGLPVVGTRHGGVVDSVVDGETGILNEPGDVEAQADAFLELARNPELRQKMGDAGRSRVATHFSPQQEAERLREIMGLPSSRVPNIDMEDLR